MARDEVWMREYQRQRLIRAEQVARMEAASVEEHRLRAAALAAIESNVHVSNMERLYNDVVVAGGFLGGNNPIPATTVWRTDTSTTFNIPEIPAVMVGAGRPSERVGASNRPRTTTVGDKFLWLQ